ncbi:MAG: hypothetical protein EP338_12810 [Bacteroidetes bacterium]|nr:MAG: hypothetical protein EP338_12810 [Bacteroidota bacterium]
MENSANDWTREDLHAYILIWCAHADFNESKEEHRMILAKVGGDHYEKMLEEFEQDNDYQHLEKIRSAMNRFNYSHEESQALVAEMKKLFEADGHFDSLEQSLFLGLKRLFA